jgi:hypothetical protein
LPWATKPSSLFAFLANPGEIGSGFRVLLFFAWQKIHARFRAQDPQKHSRLICQQVKPAG